jgi:hypothetical protein
MNAKQEILYNALERKLPEGWVIRCGDFPSHIITFNPKFGTLAVLRIDLQYQATGDWRIRFQHPHRSRKWNRKNAEHFATLVADEAQRLETVLDDLDEVA